MMPQLVYDVGMHNGDDTAYYLHKGYRVVGIEANPWLAEQATQRFAAELRDGRLSLVNAGIAERNEEATFWICDDVSVWSSFDRSIASRKGSRHYPIKIQCRRFPEILDEFGTPYYCKIDIEGSDWLCLEGLEGRDTPAFVSIEMSHETGDRDIETLGQLGYRRFKMIDQRDFSVASRLVESMRRLLPERGRWRFESLNRTLRGRSRDGSWVFREGSSGPFGDDTPGRWVDRVRTLSMWRYLRDLDRRLGTSGLGGWFDIHATR